MRVFTTCFYFFDVYVLKYESSRFYRNTILTCWMLLFISLLLSIFCYFTSEVWEVFYFFYKATTKYAYLLCWRFPANDNLVFFTGSNFAEVWSFLLSVSSAIPSFLPTELIILIPKHYNVHALYFNSSLHSSTQFVYCSMHVFVC